MLSIAELPNHTHTFNDNYTGWVEDWDFRVGSDADYTWAFRNNEENTTGTIDAAEAAHENMPPFAAVNYIIKY